MAATGKPPAVIVEEKGLVQVSDAAAIETLREGDEPFFIYLHYMDPHTSYIAPEPWYSRYSTGFASELSQARRKLSRM